MIDWTEEQQMIRDEMRKFVEAEIAPNIEELEHGDTPPYDLLRKMFRTFGMDEIARERFEYQLAKKRARERGEEPPAKAKHEDGEGGDAGDSAAMQLIPIIELCRYCPGMVTAMGVSRGLTGAAIASKGSSEQMERWALDLLTMDKIGAWAITEPGSGSDAFGSMMSTAKAQPDGTWLLNGNKSFITNAPYADTMVFICKLEEEGLDRKDWKVMNFVLDKGMEGLDQTKPIRKMGVHSSPTGELFLQDVRVGPDRLLGGKAKSRASSGAKATFSTERSSMAAMALGIVERCLELSVQYSKERIQFGRPIGEFQLIQDKLARMEVARMNLQNLVFRIIETSGARVGLSLAEASAMKLYAARAAVEVAMEAVQVFGGNGYTSEYPVEQLARDAKVLQIYAGTDEIQISAIARELLSR
jgi:alkylation response protein AidB-like acyl-CoA dehydrogenase